MKRKLLTTICFFVALMNAQAQYSVGDDIYTATKRFRVSKVIDLVQPGPSWNNYSSEIYSPYTAQTEDEYDGIQSTNSDEGAFISTAVPLEYGANYVLTFKIMETESGTSSTNQTALNYVNAWTASYDQKGDMVGTANIDFQQVASSFSFVANEFVEVSWAFVDTLSVNAESDGGFLNIVFGRISTESVIATNMQLVQVVEVFDIRIAQKSLDLAKRIVADPNFDVEEAADEKEWLLTDIEVFEEAILSGYLDDESTATEYMKALDESVMSYISQSTTDLGLESFFQYVTDITAAPKKNRGDIALNSQVGGFMFRGYNWSHGSGSEYWSKGIQGSYSDDAGSVALYNTAFPPGKYYIAAKMRNAAYLKGYVRQYDRENEVKVFVGSDTISCGMIKGERFEKFYFVGEIKEGETFEAGFWYPGYSSGNIFDICDFEIRGFGEIASQLARNQAWQAFKAQWNAVVSARNDVLLKIGEKTLPWAQDSLQNALTQWDPYYNQVLEDGWLDAEGNDTGAATNEELQEWTVYQGYDGVTQYAVVRGYSSASAYVVAENSQILQLDSAIKEALSVLYDDMNSSGDKTIMEEAIAAAQAIYDDICANSNDDRRNADESAIVEQILLLDDARSAFLASVVQLIPFIDIDFSGSFTEIYDDEDASLVVGYAIDGKSDYYPDGKGRMTFGANSVELDNSISNTLYTIGYAGMFDTDGEATLRVGQSQAVVQLGEENIPTDNDVIRVQFDIFFGKLSKKYLTVELQNAAGERVGGFKLNRYNPSVEYNDFNNRNGSWNDLTSTNSSGGEGLDLLGFVSGIGSGTSSNAAICVESNRSSFDLVFDYKACSLKGSVTNGTNGICEGKEMPMLDVYSKPELSDNKVARFVLYSDYGNGDRRCWFDNLRIYKYASAADGPIFVNDKIAGDVNEDGEVNINDVVAIINVMAGTASWANANVNGDSEGSVDINDVVAVINIMAGN